MKHDLELYKEVYDGHKNLKLAAKELDMKWQTLYWHLSREGHPVTGDKERYGNDKDKMARWSEDYFKKLVPYAEDYNEDKFQAKVDFLVKGVEVDIKCSTKKNGNKNNPESNASLRWAFTTRTQEAISDFIVCFCMSGEDCIEFGEIEKLLLIPKEMYKNMQSLSVSCRKSKWFEFEVTEQELIEFFDMF